MTAWELWTWVAIGVLEVGSVAVFGWFLVEVAALWRRSRRRDDDFSP